MLNRVNWLHLGVESFFQLLQLPVEDPEPLEPLLLHQPLLQLPLLQLPLPLVVVVQVGLEMVIVTMRQTMQAAILMMVTAVE